MRRLAIVFFVVLVIIHQDFWWRDDHRTLAFGFLPISLVYHVFISILASVFWGLVCYYCWPADVDVPDGRNAGSPPGHGGH